MNFNFFLLILIYLKNNLKLYFFSLNKSINFFVDSSFRLIRLQFRLASRLLFAGHATKHSHVSTPQFSSPCDIANYASLCESCSRHDVDPNCSRKLLCSSSCRACFGTNAFWWSRRCPSCHR
jgi:hypothetical protein